MGVISSQLSHPRGGTQPDHRKNETGLRADAHLPASAARQPCRFGGQQATSSNVQRPFTGRDVGKKRLDKEKSWLIMEEEVASLEKGLDNSNRLRYHETDTAQNTNPTD